MSKVSIFLTLLTASLVAPQAYASIKNFKPVMGGLLYRSGSDQGRNPLSDSALKQLCEDGFTNAIYAYGGANKTVSCSRGQIKYQSISEKSASKYLGIIKNAASNGGKVLVHCWYGVHASGQMAAIALKQFCGYSSEQAVSYWNDHVPASIRYPKVQERIRAFQASGGLQSSAASSHCP